MQRRAMIRQTAVLAGLGLVAGEWCWSIPALTEPADAIFTPAEVAFFDLIGATIIPRTQTPGAADAAIGAFMADYASQCYRPEYHQIMRAGLARLQQLSREAYQSDFAQLTTAAAREEVLQRLADEAKATADQAMPHPFVLFQQLAVLGFFGSEPGVTQVLRYRAIPGAYQACVPYRPGQKAWYNG